jgi:hypothetical protein
VRGELAKELNSVTVGKPTIPQPNYHIDQNYTLRQVAEIPKGLGQGMASERAHSHARNT